MIASNLVANEIIDTLWAVLPVDQGKLGEALDGLCRRIDDLRRCDQWEGAIECCAKGRLVASQVRGSRGTFMFRLADGLIHMQLGAIHLSQEDLEPARESFEKAVERFRGCNRHRCQGVAWMALGETYILAEDWEMAVHGFQQSLNAFSILWSTEDVTTEMKERIKVKLETAQLRLFSDASKQPASDHGRQDDATHRPDWLPIPILGTIGAGVGRIAEQNIEGYLDLGPDHADDAKFALRVEGQSMVRCGILEGDLALIQARREVDDGTIAAVVVPESLPEGTLKRYFRESDHHRLEPCNADEPTLLVIPDRLQTEWDREGDARAGRSVEEIAGSYKLPDDLIKTYSGEVRIVGKMVGLFRKVL